MKKLIPFVLLAVAAVVIARGAFQAVVPPTKPLSKFIPAGALLFIEAKDLKGLLSDWDESKEKQSWLKSDSHSVFTRSRLLLRLEEAQGEFAKAAGVPPDSKFISEAAGGQSAIALYDIGKLEMLYISRLSSSQSARSALWQQKGKFSERKAGNNTFYVRRDEESGRVMAFAATDDFLILATREDIIAGALTLLANGTQATIEGEKWFADSISASGEQGDLRMVLNMERIAVDPRFRTYWVQQNITEMQQYRAAISDLYLNGSTYREERVLLRKGEVAEQGGSSAETDALVVRLSGFVPDDYGFYHANAKPAPEAVRQDLMEKLLTRQKGQTVERFQSAPTAPGTSSGPSGDLETRIDEAPAIAGVIQAVTKDPLLDMLEHADVKAMLEMQSSHPLSDKYGVFVGIRSAVLLVAAGWDEASVRTVLQHAIKPGITVSELGVSWKTIKTDAGEYQELNGLVPLLVTVRGQYLLIADDADLMSVLLAIMRSNVSAKPALKPAVYIAEFNHTREKAAFATLAFKLDSRVSNNNLALPIESREPEFFSGNLTSLSRTLQKLDSESVVVRDTGNRVLQTVIYHWTQ